MNVVARRIRATPVRTATESWTVIAEIVCQGDETARKEFEAVAGIASALIASESLREQPFVVLGSGPRLRVYCLYDEDAIVGDDSNEDTMSWKPTASEWTAFLPCHKDDVQWVSKNLKTKSSRFRAYDVAQELGEDVVERRGAGLMLDAERFTQT